MKFFILALMLSVVSAHADVIKLRADLWCPYTCEAGAEKPGYMIEIAKIVFEKKGHKIDYKTQDWKKTLEEVRKGIVDGAVGAAKSTDVGFEYPDSSLGKVRLRFYTPNKATWTFSDAKSLESQQLGVVEGYTYNATIDPYVAANKNNSKRIVMFTGDDAVKDAMRKLHKNDLAVYYEDEGVFRYLVKELGFSSSDFRVAGRVSSIDDELAIGFTKSNPKSKEWAKILSDGVEELRKSGELKKILVKYSAIDWK